MKSSAVTVKCHTKAQCANGYLNNSRTLQPGEMVRLEMRQYQYRVVMVPASLHHHLHQDDHLQ